MVRQWQSSCRCKRRTRFLPTTSSRRQKSRRAKSSFFFGERSLGIKKNFFRIFFLGSFFIFFVLSFRIFSNLFVFFFVFFRFFFVFIFFSEAQKFFGGKANIAEERRR